MEINHMILCLAFLARISRGTWNLGIATRKREIEKLRVKCDVEVAIVSNVSVVPAQVSILPLSFERSINQVCGRNNCHKSVEKIFVACRRIQLLFWMVLLWFWIFICDPSDCNRAPTFTNRRIDLCEVSHRNAVCFSSLGLAFDDCAMMPTAAPSSAAIWQNRLYELYQAAH